MTTDDAPAREPEHACSTCGCPMAGFPDHALTPYARLLERLLDTLDPDWDSLIDWQSPPALRAVRAAGAQAQYDQDPELQELLTQAAASPTVQREAALDAFQNSVAQGMAEVGESGSLVDDLLADRSASSARDNSALAGTTPCPVLAGSAGADRTFRIVNVGGQRVGVVAPTTVDDSNDDLDEARASATELMDQRDLWRALALDLESGVGDLSDEQARLHRAAMVALAQAKTGWRVKYANLDALIASALPREPGSAPAELG